MTQNNKLWQYNHLKCISFPLFKGKSFIAFVIRVSKFSNFSSKVSPRVTESAILKERAISYTLALRLTTTD